MHACIARGLHVRRDHMHATWASYIYTNSILLNEEKIPRYLPKTTFSPILRHRPPLSPTIKEIVRVLQVSAHSLPVLPSHYSVPFPVAGLTHLGDFEYYVTCDCHNSRKREAIGGKTESAIKKDQAKGSLSVQRSLAHRFTSCPSPSLPTFLIGVRSYLRRMGLDLSRLRKSPRSPNWRHTADIWGVVLSLIAPYGAKIQHGPWGSVVRNRTGKSRTSYCWRSPRKTPRGRGGGGGRWEQGSSLTFGCWSSCCSSRAVECCKPR